jgi:hypothetical protein
MNTEVEQAQGQERDPLRVRLRAFLVEWLGTWLVHRVYRSLRVHIVGDERLEPLYRRHGAIVFCGWHAVMVGPLFHHRHTDGYAVVSEHRDGELLARVVQQFGHTCVRGSTTRGGVRALAQLIRLVRAGHSVGITPDGPRGPRYVAQPGVVFLGQKSGCPIVPIGFASTRYWEFRSWDRFRVPKPFSRAELHYGEPLFIPAQLADADVETWRQRVEAALHRVMRDAESAAGLPPEEDVSPTNAGSTSHE